MIINQAALSGIYKSFNTLFQAAFDRAQPLKDRVAMTVPSGARSNTYAWIDSLPMLREWLGDRVVKDLAAHGYEVTNRKFESTVSVKRDDIEDDQVGVYAPMLEMLGYNARMHPDKLVFDLLANGFDSLCFDGQYFFDTDHPVGEDSVSNYGGGSGTAWYLLCTNFPVRPLVFQTRKPPQLVRMDKEDDEHVFMRGTYMYGVDYRGNAGYGLWQLAYASKDTLNAANYAAARAAMMAFTNDEGVPLGVVPNILVVPPTLEANAKGVVDADKLASGAANVWYKTADLLVVPWLA